MSEVEPHTWTRASRLGLRPVAFGARYLEPVLHLHRRAPYRNETRNVSFRLAASTVNTKTLFQGNRGPKLIGAVVATHEPVHRDIRMVFARIRD